MLDPGRLVAQSRSGATAPFVELQWPPVVVCAEHNGLGFSIAVMIDDLETREHHFERCLGKLVASVPRQLRERNAPPSRYQLVQIDDRCPSAMRFAKPQPHLERIIGR